MGQGRVDHSNKAEGIISKTVLRQKRIWWVQKLKNKKSPVYLEHGEWDDRGEQVGRLVDRDQSL